MRKVQTRLLIETQEVSVIRLRRPSVRVFCNGCGREATMLSPAAAANLVGENTSKIYLLMRSGEIHYRRIDSGKTLVCISSLGSL